MLALNRKSKIAKWSFPKSMESLFKDNVQFIFPGSVRNQKLHILLFMPVSFGVFGKPNILILSFSTILLTCMSVFDYL